MKKVFYLSFYYKNESDTTLRTYSLAGASKADYICQCLLDDGYEVEIISPCVATEGKFLPSETVVYPNRLKLRLFASLRAKTKVGRAFRRIFTQCSVFTYLIRHLKQHETLIVYHSLYYCGIVRLVKWITKCNLVLEVEEIYSDVMENGQKKRAKEISFFKCADSYIFPTELLADSINDSTKKQVIVHGIYNCSTIHQGEKTDGFIHCVYAGTLDPRKGGAMAAVAVANHLPATYCIHILGRGSTRQTHELLTQIEQTNQTSQCKVTYDGVLTGEAFSQFLCSCHIGLSTQNPNALFNNTSFPSKILTYLCNGLKVVSAKIPVVEQSAISAEITFYEEQTPETVADAILNVKLDGNDSKDLIRKLDLECKKELAQLIG